MSGTIEHARGIAATRPQNYDPERPFTLYDAVRVERLLERLTGLNVHVSTRDGFRPHRLDRVLKDAVSVL